MKRNFVITAIIVAVFLIAAVLVLLIQPRTPETKASMPSLASPVAQTPQASAKVQESAAPNVQPTPEASLSKEKTLELPITNNSLEYDFKAFISQKENEEKSIKFQYYLEGANLEKEFDSRQISELKEIGIESQGMQGKTVKNILLNPLKRKAYLVLQEGSEKEYTSLTLYRFDLKAQVLVRLFSETGKYSEMVFSRNYKYMAFSFLDSPAGSKFQESSLLQVLDCEQDRFVVSGSRDSKGILIGGQADPKYIYDYSLVSWVTNNILRLKETKVPKQADGTAKEQKELLFDLEKSSLLNLDGSTISVQGQATPGAPAPKAESEYVKTLRSLYNLTAQEDQFQKAFDMLDEQFVLKLNLLAQFGITELKKSDMDVESYSAFSSLFKAAHIDSIIQETASPSGTTLYYYQVITPESGEAVKQPLIAVFKKTDKGIKVLSLTEGNVQEKPFSK